MFSSVHHMNSGMKMAKKITRKMFIAATGRKPEQDDLERCNCGNAGAIGHFCCGWDYKHNLPMFETMGREPIVSVTNG